VLLFLLFVLVKTILLFEFRVTAVIDMFEDGLQIYKQKMAFLLQHSAIPCQSLYDISNFVDLFNQHFFSVVVFISIFLANWRYFQTIFHLLLYWWFAPDWGNHLQKRASCRLPLISNIWLIAGIDVLFVASLNSDCSSERIIFGNLIVIFTFGCFSIKKRGVFRCEFAAG